ncbi:MAG: M14 family zinc carboxypeptidase [Thermodesulfobacteriota bacterium]
MKLFCLTIGFLLSFIPAARAAEPLQTALEAGQYQELSKNEAIIDFLTRLAGSSDKAELVWAGRSAGQRPIVGLWAGKTPPRSGKTRDANTRLTVMLLGSQHGSEPSGAEVLQIVARELVQGELTRHLEQFNFILVPVSNPDGFDRKMRVNANGINLSTDFALISQPETRAVVGLLNRFQPDILLDIHESAILKKKSLGRQGYLTDFEAQFECANHAMIDGDMRGYSVDVFLPELIADIQGKGLAANRYIGEITDIHQPIQHGGLSLRNLRNYAGFRGIFSWLLENRLDPPGAYPTPRNIKGRVEKQYLCVASFLDRIRLHREKIAGFTARHGADAPDTVPERKLYLNSHYAAHPTIPGIDIPLRRRDTNELETVTFPYHGAVVTEKPIFLPAAYAVTAEHDWIGGLLDLHGIRYDVIVQPESRPGTRMAVTRINMFPPPAGKSRLRLTIDTTEETTAIELKTGDLLIRTDQPRGRLLPLLFDPRSGDAVFQEPACAVRLARQNPFFIAAVSDKETPSGITENGPGRRPLFPNPASGTRLPGKGPGRP